jgi:N-acetylmuramoyl-L-alanine amidase
MNNSHRYAGFAVLKSPEVPSILIEMGYLSNRTDERELKSPRFRSKFAAALVRGFDRYFASQQALKRP